MSNVAADQVSTSAHEQAAESILASCYDDMRRIARRIIATDQMRCVFQPTDLVNEAALRLIQSSSVEVTNQGHMLALAARTMRRVLIDESRRSASAKRHRPTLLTSWPGSREALVDIEDLDAALAALEGFSSDHARIVELRFTLGMTVEETAVLTGLAERTVKRRWQSARAWLQDYLSPGADPVTG